MNDVRRAQELDWGNQTIARLAEKLGREATIALLYSCGGIRLYIPKRPKRNQHHLWAAVLGAKRFAIACAVVGGQVVELPTGRYLHRLVKREVITLLSQGVSDRNIALRVRTSERYVRRVKHDLGMSRAPAPLR